MKKKILSVLVAFAIMLSSMLSPAVGLLDDLTITTKAASKLLKSFTVDDIKYYDNGDGTAKASRYVGSGDEIVIPSSVNGLTVTRISDYFLDSSDGITSVVIPNTVVTIGESAFSFCELTNITIPDSVKAIGEQAFFSCGRATDVYIGKNLYSIGENAFGNCFSVQNYTVSDSNKYTYDIDGVLFNKDDVLINFPLGRAVTNYVVPRGTTAIGPMAFACCDTLESVTIPDGVMSIGDEAFWLCNSLTNVDITDDVKSIGWGAFKSVPLTYFDFPESLTCIGDWAFDRTSLKQVHLPAKVSSIGFGPFENCDISEFSVDSNSRYLCTVDGVLYSKDMKTLYQYPPLKEGASFVVPEGVEKINGGAFISLPITSVTLPDSLKEIGFMAFYSTKLKEVVIPDNVTTIAACAFDGCALTKLTLGQRVKHLGIFAFSNFSLQQVYFKGNGLKKISDVFNSDNNITMYYPKGDTTWTSDIMGTSSDYHNFIWKTWNTPVFYRRDVSNATITLSNTSYEYDGYAKEPTVSVKDGSKILTEGEDYKLTYADNRYPGTASVTITGINNYEGEVKKTYTITKATQNLRVSFDKNKMVVGEIDCIYDSAETEITYSSSNPLCVSVDKYGYVTAKAKGTATITITALESAYYKKDTEKITIEVISQTSNAITLDNLTFSFSNSKKAFGYGNGYRTPLSMYYMFYPREVAKTYYDYDGLWGGNCGGMTGVSIMLNMNADSLEVKDFKSSAKRASDLSVSNYSYDVDMSLGKIIEAMQIAQSRYSKERQATKNDIETLCEKVKEIDKGGAPMYIAVFDDEGCGHAIVGYKFKKINSSESRIYVYDCNYPKNDKRYIKVTTNSSGDYTGWSYKINDKYLCSSDLIKKGSSIDFVSYKSIRDVWESRSPSGNYVARSECNTMFVNSDNFEIQNESGEVLAYMSDGVLHSTTEDIYSVDIVQASESEETSNIINLPTKAYKIVNTDEDNHELDISMVNNDQSVKVNTLADSVDMHIDDMQGANVVNIDGESGASYEVEMSSSQDVAKDNETVVYRGSCVEGDVSVGVSEDALLAKNYSESTVLVEEDYQTFVNESQESIEDYFIKLSEYSFTSDGERKEPAVTVYDYSTDEELIQGVDYEVVYSGNIEAGKATVTAYGINDYKGSIVEDFTIYEGIKAPTSLKANKKADQIELTWNEVKNASGYEIQQYKDGQWVGIEKAPNGDIDSYVVKDLSASTSYKFRVRAYVTTGVDICYGAESEEVSAKTTKAATPKISKVENVDGGAKITWGKVAGAEKYRVFQKTSTGWKTIGNTVDTTFTHKISKSNSTYTYTIRCISDDEKTYTSDYNKTGVKNTYIAQPKITKFENVNGGTKITWGKIAGASKYRLFKKTSSGWSTIATITGTSYTHKISASNTKTLYTVRCLNSSNKYISGYNSTGFTNTYIAQPKITKFENVNGGTKITWGKVAGASKYRLFVKSGSSWKTLTTTTGTSYTYKISKSNSTYTYTVRCISSDEKKYVSSYNATGYKYKYIATPQLRSVTNKSDGVRFVFKQVAGAPKYRVYRKTGSGSWTKIADVSNKKDYYLDKSAKKGVKYTYTVRCVSADGTKFVSGYNSTGLTITRK